ncbi:hypothetical protein PUN28_011548 [Cardiocondyla obscurior]|uniref:Uncharacterized protein n=1 Tax=Cardiocondyla obscurior TaxID=286306 RepID=A0AAW2FI89_9HYME
MGSDKMQNFSTFGDARRNPARELSHSISARREHPQPHLFFSQYVQLWESEKEEKREGRRTSDGAGSCGGSARILSHPSSAEGIRNPHLFPLNFSVKSYNELSADVRDSAAMEIQKRTGEGRSARQLTNILRGGAGPGRASGIGRATFSHRQYLQLCWYHAVG